MQSGPFQTAFLGYPNPGAIGWHRAAMDADVDNSAEIICEDGQWNAHLTANDNLEIVSADNADLTQYITIRGIDANGKVITEKNILTGTTQVVTTATFAYVECGWLDSECAGEVTVRKAADDAKIFDITAGQLQSYAVHHFNGQYVSYITQIAVGYGATVANGTVAFELRHYPAEADARDLGDGYAKIIEPCLIFDNTATQPRYGEPIIITFSLPIRIPKNSYVALYGTGSAANNDIWAFMQGFDVLE